jgi:hypothetical protein
VNSPTREPGSDAQLFADLRGMWEEVDPMPADLPDRVLFALDLEELDVDFELLRLVSSAQEDLSVRSAATEVNTITFSGPSVTVMVRVTEMPSQRRRLDGWIAPSTPVVVTVHHADGSAEAVVDARGRFVVDDIPAGLTRMVLAPTEEGSSPFITPTVEI